MSSASPSSYWTAHLALLAEERYFFTVPKCIVPWKSLATRLPTNLELVAKFPAAFVVRTLLAAPLTGEESEVRPFLTPPEKIILTIGRLRFALGDGVDTSRDGVMPGVRRSIYR